PQEAAAQFRRAGKDLVEGLTKVDDLLDAEVVASQVEVQVGGVTDRRYVARAVPGGAHAERHAQRSQPARRRQAAERRDMRADEVDHLPGDERTPFQRVIVQLAHGDGRSALLADVAEPLDLL